MPSFTEFLIVLAAMTKALLVVGSGAGGLYLLGRSAGTAVGWLRGAPWSNRRS